MLLKTQLEDKVPEGSLEYCVKLWNDKPFIFQLSKDRVSKLGDFRYEPRSKAFKVSVNANLNPYQFLITYVHEVAHRYTFDPKRRLKPHGTEWKSTFQRLMLPLLNTQIFPDDVLRVLARHMKNPKASTSADPLLVKALAKYSGQFDDALTLKDLPIQAIFKFRGKEYKKLQEKRTRALCEETSTGKRYLVPMIIPV